MPTKLHEQMAGHVSEHVMNYEGVTGSQAQGLAGLAALARDLNISI